MVTCSDCGRSLAGQKRQRWAGGLHEEKRRICDVCAAALMGIDAKQDTGENDGDRMEEAGRQTVLPRR